jgi:hypothetical protein
MATTVFVLGAGFTKSFVPDAPLLVDDYYDASFGHKFEAFSAAHNILETERRLCGGGTSLNLERLWTRLSSGMPYDSRTGAGVERPALLAEVKKRFMDRLTKARAGTVFHEDLYRFAAYCRLHKIDCITFNYDDFFDKALWRSQELPQPGHASLWHPEWGYGFPAKSIRVGEAQHFRSEHILLLKLHGSINWRVKLGQPKPYAVDAIKRHDEWFHPKAFTRFPGYELQELRELETLLEPEPFMVPPILTKNALMEEPLLKLLWSRAYEILRNAEQVTFIGYSLPVTDIAASTMFREAFSRPDPPSVRVVDYAPDGHKDKKMAYLLDAYRAVFPDISEKQIDLRGGLLWSRELVEA